MGQANRWEFRKKYESILMKKYGDAITATFFFFYERHKRKARNKFIIVLKAQSNGNVDNLYKTCEDLGITLKHYCDLKYWHPLIFLFNSQEEANFFCLNFNEKISCRFDFEEIYEFIRSS